MYDIIIKNGKIIDGTGSDGYFSDVAIEGGKIKKIGKDIEGGKLVIDAKGLVVTPGFIDSHSHSDKNLLTYPEQIEKVEQGITTSAAGMCGASIYPLPKENASGESLCDKYETMGELLSRADSIAQGSNTGLFVGHRNLRRSVMGMENREPTEEEMNEMKALLRDGLENGAIGVSFGLIYTPSCYAKTDELISLARVAAEYGALVSAHIRDEGDFVEEAVTEFITIIKASGARGIVSHHKAMHKKNHGKVNNTLKMIEAANAEGFDIYCDVYPYIASETTLEARFIPGEYRKESERLVEYLNDEKTCREIKDINLKKWGSDLSWVLINKCEGYPEYTGLTLDKIAEIHGKDVYETVFDILRESGGSAQAAYFTMSEDDVDTVISYPRAMICTDPSAARGMPLYHPRLRGSFPRALGRYVRERKAVTLPEMIRKMTSLPAYVYGFETKGIIKEGMDADICIFNPETICDRADFADCTRRAEGLSYVIVNGAVAAEDAVYTGAMSGKVLLRKVK